MTEDELSLMERMWSMHVPAKRIAEALGYSTNTVLRNAMSDRQRFPYRRKKIGRGKRELWIERVISGRCTKRQAMMTLGVCEETMNRWLRNRREEDGMSISRRSENLYTDTLTRRNLCDMVATLEDDKRKLMSRMAALDEVNKSMVTTIARLEEELAEKEDDSGDQGKAD